MSMLRGTPGLLPSLRDTQDVPPLRYCKGCQAELYDGYGEEKYCPECLEERNGKDHDP